MSFGLRLPVLALALGACASSSAELRSSPTPDAPGPPVELVTHWNRLLLSIAEEEDGFLTLKGVRTAAMMHVAMHDALNSIDPRYQIYAFSGAAPLADPGVAAAQAAYEVASNQYPDREAQLAQELGRWTEEDPGAAAEGGIELGKAAAAAILERRAQDRWDAEVEYTWHPMGPGVYADFAEHSGTPEGFVFGAGWAEAEPFLLESQDQFRSPPPPQIESEDYTRAFREVKALGRFESDTRTPDQSHCAMWWKEFVESSHNRLARELATQEQLDPWRAARLFALLDMSIYDAYVSVFENKFFYNHWRPYTAVRWAENDGNPDTEADAEWTNTHQHTYAFPSYPSAHGCASAAAMEVLADTFGSQKPFTMTIPRVDRAGPFSGKVEMDPSDRSFDGFQEAALECALSRLYLGIHFRYDSLAGNALGTDIGRYAVENFLTRAE